MATGFCPALLDHLAMLTPENYPGYKVPMPGFLAGLLSQKDRPTVLQSDMFNLGHTRTVNIKYKQRSTETQVGTAEDCDVDILPAWKETSMTVSQVAQISFHLPDSTMRQYCADASKMVALGGAARPTSLMQDTLETIFHQMAGLYSKIDRVCATTMATKFGRNANGGGTSKNLNFSLDGTKNNFAENWGRLKTDLDINEMCGNGYWMCGNGNFHVWYNQYAAGALSANQSGFNNAAFVDGPFYYDQKTASTWGDNKLGIFANGSVHLIEYNKNVGSYAVDLGTVVKTQFFDPRVQCWTPAGYKPMAFDLRLKYIDCPTTLTNGYTGNSANFTEGWAVYISKTYDLFTMPTDMYDGNDPNVGGNGTLQYTITNA